MRRLEADEAPSGEDKHVLRDGVDAGVRSICGSLADMEGIVRGDSKAAPAIDVSEVEAAVVRKNSIVALAVASCHNYGIIAAC